MTIVARHNIEIIDARENNAHVISHERGDLKYKTRLGWNR